jgi:uncharacterized RDD family membrane protein YckC
MESIDILTGQHVAIKYEPASVIARLGALLLDYFFMSVYFFALLYTLFNFEDSLGQLMSLSQGITYTLIVVLYLPFIAYHFIFESLTGGKTLGKMIVKIQVTRMDGSIPGIGAYFLRWLLMPVDMFTSGGIGALFIIFSSYHQRIGDMAAGTIVVKTNPSLRMDLDETFYEFSDDYEPTFKDAAQLSEGQITFITNLLLVPNKREALIEPIHELAQKVKGILNADSFLNDRIFLETIVRDYNYYATLDI